MRFEARLQQVVTAFCFIVLNRVAHAAADFKGYGVMPSQSSNAHLVYYLLGISCLAVSCLIYRAHYLKKNALHPTQKSLSMRDRLVKQCMPPFLIALISSGLGYYCFQQAAEIEHNATVIMRSALDGSPQILIGCIAWLICLYHAGLTLFRFCKAKGSE